MGRKRSDKKGKFKKRSQVKNKLKVRFLFPLTSEQKYDEYSPGRLVIQGELR